MMKAGRDENIANAIKAKLELHKSCDRCGLKKRKCDGKNPCGRCTRIGQTCIYSKRRSRANRPQTPGPVYVGSASDPSLHAPSTLQAGLGGVSAALQQYGRVALKRCRLSPSPATGLVGMQENMFLSDYFLCVGFLPFTSQSNIRETLVNMFVGPASLEHSQHGDYSTTDHQHFDTLMTTDSQVPVGPSTCVFWCAVALGALVKGRPIESVEKYSRLAREALANNPGPANAEVGRAWAILAYMSDFCGDRDNFHVFVKRANTILFEVQQQEDETLPVGLSEVVKHGETIRIFVGDVNEEEVESFVNQERSVPQITRAATEGEICKFIMQSYRAFEQDFYRNVVEHQFAGGSLGGDGEEPSGKITAESIVAGGILRGSSPHFITSLIRERAVGSDSSGMLDMMIAMLKQHAHQFEQIEFAAGRKSIRGGIGGLIINGSLVFEKVTRNDISGALESLEICGEVFQRYPGLCRFTMGTHIAHMLLANLAVIDGPRARTVYDKVTTAYNSALLPGTPAIPPFEEWQGVSSCCNNYNCRLMEYMVSREHRGTSSPPPLQELAAGMQQNGPRDIPVHDRQEEGLPSAAGSREGVEGSSVLDARPRRKNIDSWTSKVGCTENVSFDGRRTAITQPQEPTLTTSSVFREVGSEPMADSDVSHVVNGQSCSDRSTGSGPQEAESLFLLDLSKGSTGISETEDDSIDVEDWLDVTHAMLDTSGPGVNVE